MFICGAWKRVIEGPAHARRTLVYRCDLSDGHMAWLHEDRILKTSWLDESCDPECRPRNEFVGGVMTELKACPFCGSKNIDPRGWLGEGDVTGPACYDCGGSAGESAKTAQENVVLWNTRPLEEALREELRMRTEELARMTQERANEAKEAGLAEAAVAKAQRAAHGED